MFIGQISVVQALFDLFGGFAFLVWAFYQTYAPKWLNRTTIIYSWKQEIHEKIEQNTTEVQTIKDRQESQIQVQRAQARATDEMDEDRVDKYLIKNGVTVDEFLDDPDESKDTFYDDEQ